MLDTPRRTRPALLALVLSLLAAALPLAAAQDDGAIVLRAGERERTIDQFETRFEIALHALAARQGVQLNERTRAQFEPLAPRFLEQRAREVALLAVAADRGLAPSEDAIDQAVAEVRGDAGAEAFAQRLARAGIPDAATYRRLVREGETIALLRREVAADVEVSEEELRQAFEADPERFGGEDGPTFEEAREELAATVRQRKVGSELQALAERVEVETFPARLPYGPPAGDGQDGTPGGATDEGDDADD